MLEACLPSECLVREQYYIDNNHPEYNIDPTAGSPLGRRYSDEYKNKVRERTLGENNPFFGKKHSETSIRLMSKNRKGKCKDLLIGNKNPMYGKTHTDENKMKMSTSSKDFWNSPMGSKLRKKKSDAMIGNTNPNARKGLRHPKYNHFEYTFTNDITNSVFIGTVYDFRKTFNICSEIYNLLKGKYKQYKGWRVTKNEKI